jgi:hypothetical protein
MKRLLLLAGVAIAGSASADLIYGQSTLVFPAGPGVPRAGTSYSPEISSDGRYISFITDRMDVRAYDEVDSFDVVRADAVGGAVKVVNRLANGTYYAPIPADGTFISNRGQFIAFTSSRVEVPGSPIDLRRSANRAKLDQKIVNQIPDRFATGLSNDGLSIVCNQTLGRTYDPSGSFEFNGGYTGQEQPSVYSSDTTVRLANVTFGNPPVTGIQAVNRSRRFWLFNTAGIGESFLPVWVSNDPSLSGPIEARFITNKQISPIDFDFDPDLYQVNTATGERRLIQLSGTSIRSVATSRNGRFTIVKYTNGMADLIDLPFDMYAQNPTRQVDLRNLRTLSKHISDDGRYIAGITEDGRLVRHDLMTNTSVETGVGPYPGPPKAPLYRHASSNSGTSIIFRAGSQFIAGQTSGVFIKNIATGMTRKLETSSEGSAVSDSGQAYVHVTGTGTTYRNDDLNLSISLPNTFGHVISNDGLIVMFRRTENLIDQVYVYDVLARHTRLVSRGVNGLALPEVIQEVRMSANGKTIAFISDTQALFNGPARPRLYVYDVSQDRLNTTTFSDEMGTKSSVLGISADGLKVIFRNRSRFEGVWRFYVPTGVYTALLRNISVPRDSKISPSGNLLFEVQQYGNRLIRLSDGRIEFLSTDDPFFVLPGDNRARIDTNGVLRDVNFTFPIAP